MWKPLARASIIGGLIAFLWSALSWMVLPFHEKSLHQFDNEEVVSSAILENTRENGLYVMPHMKRDENGQVIQDQSDSSCPFVYANVVRGGRYNTGMAKPMILGIAIQIIGAFIITWLLLKTKALKYWARVRFVTLIGFLVGFLSAMPFWNWWSFTAGDTFLTIADYTIAWFLAGLAMAKLVKKS